MEPPHRPKTSLQALLASSKCRAINANANNSSSSCQECNSRNHSNSGPPIQQQHHQQLPPSSAMQKESCNTEGGKGGGGGGSSFYQRSAEGHAPLQLFNKSHDLHIRPSSPATVASTTAADHHLFTSASKELATIPRSFNGISSSSPPPLLPATKLSELFTSKLTLEDNWQMSKKNIRDRSAVMFMSEVMSDVHFLVGGGCCGSSSPMGRPPPRAKSHHHPPSSSPRMRIPAHKYVLATASSVFFAMFYGPLAERKEEIEIPDVEPSAFIIMLRSPWRRTPSSPCSTAPRSTSCRTWPKICVKYLESNLTAQNACLLLSQSRLFDETVLVERCFEVIDAQAELALASDGFTQIDSDTVRRILSRETLNAKEVVIFEAALNWATAECRRQKLEPTAENQRSILGDILFCVRIPAMTLEEFANGPAQVAILSVKEINDIFLHYVATNKPSLDFLAKPRLGLTLQKCHRFLSSAYRSNQWRYRGRCDSIQFSVDKRIFVVGFGLYGSSNGAAEYKVKIELKRTDCVLATKCTRFFSDGSSNTFPVYFDTPIQIEADIFYIASVVLDGSELSYFGQDGLNEVSLDCDVNFQFQCSAESTNGTGVQGGQIPEILLYAPSKQSRLLSGKYSH
ncbi:BTB POZ domain-containing protein [Tyrophagus putrescentiae]|nr:BTB POZ domain-containing protein [Tyrophagus putrescentiae]